jgi:hypothetical protein
MAIVGEVRRVVHRDLNVAAPLGAHFYHASVHGKDTSRDQTEDQYRVHDRTVRANGVAKLGGPGPVDSLRANRGVNECKRGAWILTARRWTNNVSTLISLSANH